MNLFEMLDVYKTNPVDEIRKISSLLNRWHEISFEKYSLEDAFSTAFSRSIFSSHEPTFGDFVHNVVLKGLSERDSEGAIKNYRYYCEFIMALIDTGIDYPFDSEFSDDIDQLEKIMSSGLRRCGFVIVKLNGHRVTKKIDEQAEAVASTNGQYKKNIFDYLLAKTVDEKEKILTALAIQLEASEPKDKYSKQNREFVQLPRHKDEKKNEKEYSWFFIPEKYEDNLDKLFKIYLATISHDNCHDYLEEFKKNREGSK